ncbi:peptidylprolyl isomerase [Diaphorobacter aerolatus]|uniref:peptidylprolyl isomerase n=1 Tax=Diaphorobacter aerolatus TaxID=1288495 RepID=A0A7H0GNU1_9BURK|nr:peptidylprolyl isomerase [Diaphorobacter aerolatus]QNP49957.1 peptidylprolyl isomerase [Diaphorobacter aerolatus]
MRTSRKFGAAAFGLFLVTGALAAQPAVVMEVGGINITDQDIRAELQNAPAPTRERTLENPAVLKQIASTLAARRLLAQEAEKNGLAATPQMKAQLQLAKERVLSTARLEQIDASHMPDAKAIDSYARDFYRSNPKAFEAPPETHVRHILIEGDKPASKAKAEKLLAELKAGADFQKLAKENSEDKTNGPNGGDLGFAPDGRYVPEFERAIGGLSKEKPLSDVVKTQFGYHIIQYVEQRPARVVPYEDVADRLKADSTTKLLSDKRVEKNKALIKDATVHEDALKAMAASKPAAAAAAPAKK